MKTLVIADIHHCTKQAESIIDNVPHDKVVFLGDWFDDFDDDEITSRKTALWLKSRMIKHPEDIFCLGNHDVAYGWPGRHTPCSGFSTHKHDAIFDIMQPADWDRFVWYHWEPGNYLLSHAGLTKPHVAGVKDIPKYLAQEAEKASMWVRGGYAHWMFSAGLARGGRQPFGGLTWCDLSEFIPIKDINQIFGHTPQRNLWWQHEKETKGKKVPRKTNNFCIDAVGHARHYAVIDGGIATVHDGVDFMK